MSQTGPASRHASRRSSRSPAGDDQVSPSSTRYGQPGARDTRQDLSSVPYTNGENRAQQVQPRTLGVHNILNPLEPQLLSSGASGPLHTTVRPHEGELPAVTPGSTPGPFPAARLFPAAQPASISLPGTPVGPLTPLGGPSSERNSPTMAFPFPAVNNPRRKPSPTQPPRAMSLSHGPPSNRDSEVRQLPPHSVSPAKRPYESEAMEETTRSHFPGLQHLPGMPSGPPSAMSTPGRTLSQPAIPSPGTQAPPPILPPSTAPARPQQPPMPPQGPYPPNMQTNRQFPGAGPPSEASSPWTETIRRHGMGGALFGVEGQQAFMTLPGSDTPIAVPVDFSQASKKADEKRQRNAVASTRHRRKKKILQEENTKQLQELRDERRMMEIKIEELTQQRDFYREERNRLRDIVAQTPSISGLAVGPPSPNFASGSFTDTSSLAPGPQGPQGYGGDSSTGERPAQRRRTDDRPEFSIPSYGSPASIHPGASPSGLPPMQGPGYGGPSRPSSAASSTSGERLPPLRAMDGRPPPVPGQGQVQEQDPRTGQWVSVQPRVPETGWATRDTHRR
ncbi:BZIP domain-containing protein [Fusarium keratoplasticum]|uniref:BZIP domain-containing protein n=1 Tax=Fusarium keratoplasticum TaxID=1328300 RepID=A0ACC0R2J9_9HYPO|nr:BZIP domain-containing protein [Fusarium keratoplasticum]KAI8671624.1 BZIP domain-containing protein [Fusarium keratoplasticum]KAI8678847.1 BZIP domain-containing protein [Fusarium keratoplasticum]